MPKPALTPEQQEFLQALVGELANKAADVLEQRGLGSFHQLFQQYGHMFHQQGAPQQPPPQYVPPPGSAGPRAPYQPILVNRQTEDGSFRTIEATVPQLLAEQADLLIRMNSLLEILALDRDNGHRR